MQTFNGAVGHDFSLNISDLGGNAVSGFSIVLVSREFVSVLTGLVTGGSVPLRAARMVAGSHVVGVALQILLA